MASLTVEGLRQATAAVLTTLRAGASLRNALHDVLWEGQGPVMVERTRRTLAAAIDIDDLVVDSDRFETILDRWWVLGTPDPFAGRSSRPPGRSAGGRGATLRRNLVNVPARFAAPARKPSLHLPALWHRQQQWMALWHNVITYPTRQPRARLTPDLPVHSPNPGSTGDPPT